jgi:GntR family transcriptional regulator
MIQSVLSTLSHSIRLDFRSEVPLYLQIVEQLRALIDRQVLQPGQQLPTVRALATELRVNFNTVARAYRVLDEAGVISAQRGRGTFVSEIPPPAVSFQGELLRSLAERFVAQAQSLGASEAEIRQAVDEVLRATKA